MQRDKVYIFDISNMIHRAFHSTGELSTSDGFPTGAIYGTMNMMLRFIERYKPTHILVCYDAQTGKSVRKAMYPEYKANRVGVNAVSAEEKIIRRFFQLLSIPSVELEGYEADDLIGTAVEKLAPTMDVVIVTGDKDMLQLIRSGVQVHDSMKNLWYGPDEATLKFGVRPDQISDYLAICGDSVDNVPGVAGVGPKGAEKLLKSFSTVEDIYANLDTTDLIDAKMKKKLMASKDMALLSKKLTSLFLHLDVNITPDSVIFKPVKNQGVYPLIERLEFKNMATRIEMMWHLYE